MNHAAAVAGVAVMKNSTPIYSVILLKLPSFARADTLVGSLVGPSILIPVSSLPLFLHISATTSGQYQPVHGARVHIRRGDVQPPPALGKV